MRQVNEETFWLMRQALIMVADRAYSVGVVDATKAIGSMGLVRAKSESETTAMNEERVDSVLRAAGLIG